VSDRFGLGIAALQRMAGNHAVAALITGPTRHVQRDVGWADALGWNKGTRDLGGAEIKPTPQIHQIVRIPLASLTNTNQEPSPNPEKTPEGAAGRAIVWVRPDLDPTKPVQVLVHLHGLTSREADPFPGWRETNDDPKTEESDKAKAAAKAAAKEAARQAANEAAKHKDDKAAQEAAKEAAKKAKEDPPNPLAHQVRDVVRDRIGAQVDAMKDAQLVAILPQGSGDAHFGKNFDADAITKEVFDQLVAAKTISSVPKSYEIMLSAHSGGGFTVTSALDAGRTGHLGGVILFDALHTNKGDPTESGQVDALLGWIRKNCRALGAVLKDPAAKDDVRSKAIAALPGVRGYYEAGYSNPYEGLQGKEPKESPAKDAPTTDPTSTPPPPPKKPAKRMPSLQQQIDAIVKATIPAAYAAQVNAKFVITKVSTTHDQIVGGNAKGTGVSTAPLQDALAARSSFVAQADPPATVQRDDHAPAPVAVTLTWTGDLPNAAQLQPVLTADPADLTAVVTVDGGAPATVAPPHQLNLTPGPHTISVAPTAGAPGNYFLANTQRVVVPAGGGPVAVTLPFNRDNVRFTERTWVVNNIDPAKANNTGPARLFGLPVNGGLNALTAPRVAATNAWFTDPAHVSPADQAAATASIVSIVGTVKRAQSRGTFSNHSTGAAVDVNPSSESLQNWHVKKAEARDKRAMGIFSNVVSLHTPGEELMAKVEAALFGNALPMPFDNWDVWRERDRDRLLEASQRFNAAFPDHLLGLVTTADPAAAPAPTTASVMTLSAADLRNLAAKARRAGHADVTKALTDIANTWFEIRAWISGYVWTNRFDRNHERIGMLTSDFNAARARDPGLQQVGSTMTGMITLHPAIVKALTENGWSWMVDYAHDNEKDFMHFEDRTAQAGMHP
jgi:hypothetical protein